MADELPWVEQIESAIVDRLKAKFPELSVEALDEKNFRFTHPKGAILVGWVALDVNSIGDIGQSVHDIGPNFEVVLKSRSLRDRIGLYQMLVGTIGALLGWVPVLGKPLALKRALNGGYDDGAWQAVLTFSTGLVLVPELEPETATPMTTIQFNNCGEDCEECQQ